MRQCGVLTLRGVVLVALTGFTFSYSPKNLGLECVLLMEVVPKLCGKNALGSVRAVVRPRHRMAGAVRQVAESSSSRAFLHPSEGGDSSGSSSDSGGDGSNDWEQVDER